MAEFVIPAAVLPEENTLRHYLRNFPKGMPEDCIAVVLNATIKGINHIHTIHPGGEPDINTGLIGVFWDSPHKIRVAYHEDHMRMGAYDDPHRSQVGIWGAGIVALELAYGSLPENITPVNLVNMANNLLRILGLKLTTDEKKKIKKLPNNLQMLLDNGYVGDRERQLIAKNNARGIQWVKTLLQSSVRSLPYKEPHQKRSFSRDFLYLIYQILYKEHPPTIDQILEHPFLKNVSSNDMDYFERVVR